MLVVCGGSDDPQPSGGPPVSDSPVSDHAINELVKRVERAWRLVASRAPAEIRERVLTTLEEAGHMDAESQLAQRVRWVRQLETLEDELRGRDPSARLLYEGGRLGMIHVWDPVRIRETIDDRRVRTHLIRYQQRAQRAMRRLHWFYERAGLEVEPPPDRPVWEQPYYSFMESREFLWRSLRG